MQNPISTLRSTLVLTLFCAIFSFSMLDCGPSRPVASPADLQRLGNHVYPGRNREQVVQAIVTSLRLLGFEVITTAPRVRTAPRALSVAAVGNRYSAHSIAETISWDIDLREGPQGVVVQASRHLYFNGQESDQFWLDAAEQNYAELFREVDGNFQSATP